LPGGGLSPSHTLMSVGRVGGKSYLNSTLTFTLGKLYYPQLKLALARKLKFLGNGAKVKFLWVVKLPCDRHLDFFGANMGIFLDIWRSQLVDELIDSGRDRSQFSLLSHRNDQDFFEKD